MTTPRQRSTIAIAMLCLAAQVLAVSHLVLVRHARCAEHGEVMHVSSEHAAAPCEVGPDTVLTGTDDRGAVDDDHCEWLSDRRDIRHASSPVFGAAAIAMEVPPAAPIFAPAASQPLYRLAPKLSPPHAVA